MTTGVEQVVVCSHGHEVVLFGAHQDGGFGVGDAVETAVAGSEQLAVGRLEEVVNVPEVARSSDTVGGVAAAGCENEGCNSSGKYAA